MSFRDSKRNLYVIAADMYRAAATFDLKMVRLYGEALTELAEEMQYKYEEIVPDDREARTRTR